MSLNKGTVRAKDVEAINQQDVTTIKEALALDNVDNTSDADKPISTDTQNALNDKVDKVAGKGLSDENYTLAEKDRLANTSGTNTGDQDLSNYVDQADAKNLSLGENYANVKINDFVNDGFDVYPTDAGYQYAKLLQQDKLNDTKVLLLPQAAKAGELGANKGSNFTASRATEARRVNENGLIESVAVNVPRIDYTNGNCPSILVEGQATNLVNYSEEFDNAVWTKVNLNITGSPQWVDVAVAPDGKTTAEKIIADTTTGKHGLQQGVNLDAGKAYTFSAYFKKSEYEFARLAQGSSGGAGLSTRESIVNLTNGNIEIETVNGQTKVTKLSNDWYRIAITTDVTTGSGAPVFVAGVFSGASGSDFSGNNVDGIFVWGAQLEEGTEPSSYIPTTSSAVTRNADVISKTGISSLINSNEGVLYGHFKSSQIGSHIGLTDGTILNRVLIYSTPPNKIRGLIQSGGTNQAVFDVSGDPFEFNKIAIKWKSNDFAFWINGVEVATDNSGASPIGMSQIYFSDGIGGGDFHGNVKELALYKTALTNDELATLTTL